MKTRKQYLNGDCSHREYYAQFVNAQVKETLLRYIPLKTLLASTDEHLNDIPLTIWDNMPHITAIKFEDVGDYKTLAGSVCVLKETARQIIEDAK